MAARCTSKAVRAGCKGYWMNEREVVKAVLPVLVELVQNNLREHLEAASKTDPLHVQMEGEIKAELAKINQSMKNLLEAVKQGALSMEQVKEENADPSRQASPGEAAQQHKGHDAYWR